MIANNSIGTLLFDYLDGVEMDHWFQDNTPEESLGRLLIGSEPLTTYTCYYHKDKESPTPAAVIGNSSDEETKKACNDLYEQLIREGGQKFAQLIEKEDFEDEDLSKAYSLLGKILDEYPYVSIGWLVNLYQDVCTNDEVLSRLLSLVSEYAYNEDLSGFAILIAKAELNNHNDDVIDEAMSIFENLPKEKAKEAMATVRIPDNPFLRLKYNTIVNALN